jgi:hypothetical protein
MMPFIDLLLMNHPGICFRGELSIGKDDLSFGVLLTLSFGDIVLTG